MIPVSEEFKTKLQSDNKPYIITLNITLQDGATLVVTNNELVSAEFEDVICEDSTFGALGSAAIGQATIAVSNSLRDFTQYDFQFAKVTITIGLQLSQSLETVNKGKYIIDSTSYNDGYVTLVMLDNMSLFDRPYTLSDLIYPATLDTIIRNACSVCDVQLDTYDFPHKDFVVDTKPQGESLTFRAVIAWAAAVAGCFAKVNNTGKLTLEWFNIQALRYVDVPNNNRFDITSLYSQNIAVDDTVITGVQIDVTVLDKDSQQTIKSFNYGTEGYVIKLTDNQFLTESNAQQVVNWLGAQLVNTRFRKASITHTNNPTIEAGDVAVITDRKGNKYPILISRTNFAVNKSQTTVCASETPNKNSSTRYTKSVDNLVKLKEQIYSEYTDRQQAIAELSEQLAEAAGLYSTQQTTPSGTIYYLHDKPSLADSMVVWKMTAEAWGVSTDGGQTWNAGMTVDGDTIVRILTATGVNADWINAGQLVVKDQQGNETMFVDTDTGVVRIKASQFSVSGKTVPEIATEAAEEVVDTIQVGSRNYLRKTATPVIGNPRWQVGGYTVSSGGDGTGTIETITDSPIATITNTFRITGNTTGNRDFQQAYIPLQSGLTYTFSAYVRAIQQPCTALIRLWKSAPSPSGQYAGFTKAVGLNWEKIKFTFKVPEENFTQINMQFGLSGAGNIEYIAPKVELGNISTDWTPAPEDAEDELSNFAVTVNQSIQDIQDQLDGVIDTYYYDYMPTLNNVPANAWTTETLKEEHEGDLFLDTSTGKSYRFVKDNGTWQWKEIPDTASAQALLLAQQAMDTADGKRRVFIDTPFVPYDRGDLWMQGINGDIMTCTNAKTASQSYSVNDWSKLNKYIDQSAVDNLQTYIEGELSTMQQQVDGKIETFYQGTDPSTGWSASQKAEHTGDIWYNTSSEKTFRWNGSTWQETVATPPSEIIDSIDGKAQVFIRQPVPPYHEGDLWFDSATADIMTCINTRLTGSFVASDWEKRNKYSEEHDLVVDYKWNTGETIASFEAKVYLNNVDVTADYPDNFFRWYLRNENSVTETLIAIGKTCTVTADEIGYGSTVITEFALYETYYLTDIGSNVLTTRNGDRLMAWVEI